MAVEAGRDYRSGVRWAGYLLTGLGVSVVIGWFFNVGLFLTVLPGRISMKPNAALGFLCAGVCLVLLTSRSAERKSQFLCAALSAIVTAVGLLTLLEYGFHFNLHIDQLFFKDLSQHPYPGRMAHITALNFCLAGLSLFLLSISEKQTTWPQVLSLLTGLSALLAIVGYLYGVPLLYGSVSYSSMALHTGAGFLLLAAATLHCRPAGGLMAVVTSPYVGGWLCRSLIPSAIVVPVLLGAAYIHGNFALNDVRLALACLIVSQIILFVGLIWTSAFLLNRSELGKRSATAALRESEKLLEQRYRNIFEEAIIGIFQTTPQGTFLSVNPAMAHIYGYDSPEEMMTEVTDIAHQLYVDPERRTELKQHLAREGVVRNFECQVYRRDRKKMWVSANARAVQRDGKITHYDGTFEDITERKSLEEQLRQAQKMEAVGRLAGGIAHDFNNAIGVIVGYSALIKEGVSPNDELARFADEVDKAGNRAASLTRQLLAFSRKQVIQPTIVDLNSVLTEIEKMLRRLIGEDITLAIIRASDLGRVKVDVGQIDQILMNLAVNARDAMPTGGKLIIETANAELDDSNLSGHPYAKPGHYVMISVSDTGCGMDKKTLSHIFEPFYTTKAPGQGTGLGLSTVYGIVKQSEGYIWVYSEPEKGACFKIYFPRVEGAVRPVAAAVQSAIPRGSQTILLVEDDEGMRTLTRTCLESNGYTVLDVANGEKAIGVVARHSGPIHLLLTDIVMPGISGRQLAESLKLSRPEMKCLYMSGYTADLVAQHGILEPEVVLLEKPFTRETLLRKVWKVLQGDSRARAAGVE